MSMEEALSAADQLRGEARVFTRFGDLSRARDVLTDLVALLTRFLTGDDDVPRTNHAVAVRLADTYGMIGGVECRRGNLQKAFEAYSNGRKIEETGEYGVSDSYNLTNTFVVLLFIDSKRLQPMQEDIAKAMATVRKQVDGERRDQWWAWADYGLLCLLKGDEAEASHAYDRFAACGPAASDYQSVRRVLSSLAKAVSTADEETARQIQHELLALESAAPPEDA